MSLGPLQDEFRKHTQEAAQVVALRENAINMGLKGDALVAGVIDNSAAATKEAQGSISEMAEKQAKQQADDALFMAMLNDLDAQIAAKQDEIDGLNEQIAAAEELIGIFERNGDLDPTDPAQMRLLNLLEIPEEEWGTVTQEQIEAKIEELEGRRDIARAELDEAKRLRAALEVNPDAVEEEFKAVNQRVLGARPDAIATEGVWFKASIAELKSFKLYENYIDSVDDLIDSLSEDVRAKLLEDPEVLGVVSDRLHIHYFEEEYSSLLEYKDNPNYSDWLAEMIDDLDEETRSALLRSDHLPRDVEQLLSTESLQSSYGVSLNSTTN